MTGLRACLPVASLIASLLASLMAFLVVTLLASLLVAQVRPDCTDEA
jgi:hypothetical protein